MRILFFVPQHAGHHFAYLARMLPGFVGLPVEIVVATTAEALESVEFAKSLAPFGDRLQVVAECTRHPKSPVSGARHRLKDLRGAIRKYAPDHVAVCYADGLWDQACIETLLGRRPWPRDLVVEGWIFRGRFGDFHDRRIKSIVRRKLFQRLLRQRLFAKLHLHHELLYEFARPLRRPSDTEVVLAPDPIEILSMMPAEEARRELGVPGDGRWVGVAGVIAEFKGAHLFLEAFRRRREQAQEPAII